MASQPDTPTSGAPLRRWQAPRDASAHPPCTSPSHLPPAIAQARFPALSARLLEHAARIQAERERGEILDAACAMSAVPTVMQEIWSTSGELETFALHQAMQIETLTELLGEHTRALSPDDSPAVAPRDTFDWLHLALECLLRTHEDNQRLHSN